MSDEGGDFASQELLADYERLLNKSSRVQADALSNVDTVAHCKVVLDPSLVDLLNEALHTSLCLPLVEPLELF